MRQAFVAAAGLSMLVAGVGAASSQRLRSVLPSGDSYLGGRPMVDSLLLVPPPPAPGSAAEARDIAASKAALALRGTTLARLATDDADLSGGHAVTAFSCAAGVSIGPATTPHLDRLLGKMLRDLAFSTAAIKAQYRRQRPFVSNNQPTCAPQMEAALRRDGSYPSGHSAIGYGTALILAELVPDRTAPIMARGRAFGESRMICNAHWQSDVEEGRLVAAATVARLHADPVFRHDLDAARAELTHPHAPPTDCAAETAALADTMTIDTSGDQR